MIRSGKGRFLALLSAAVISLGSVTAFGSDITVQAAMNTSEFASGYSYPTQMRGLTAFQLVSDMGAGWNLGNSLESSDSETNWGNPKTTKSMIDAIAAKGFTTLRVPVRWDDHYSDSSKYIISAEYMDRVETVVNYGLANGMYVILNVHHNDLQAAVSSSTSAQNKISEELAAIWKQIGTRFKNYGDKLIFEVNNEPRCGEDWTGNASYYKCVNANNEAARAAIRATGGNNAKRLIMLPTYCASGDAAKAEAWSNTSGDSMIAASIHAYLPFDFAFSGDGHKDWQASDLTELSGFFTRMYNTFISKGVPVVIGEFGATNKSNTAYREKYAGIYASLARQFAAQDIPCVWWDNNCFGTGSENFGIFNRGSRSFTYGGIADALVAAYNGDPQYETATGGENVLFSGTGTSSNYGQAVSFDPSAITSLSSSDKIYCSYSSYGDIEFILQSFTDSSRGWIQVAPDSASNGTAVWSVSSLKSAFGGSFSGLGKAYIGDRGSSLTVTKVYVPGGTAHTHVYNGKSAVALEATAYTKGRKQIYCSVSGCTAYRIVTVPKLDSTRPVITSVTAGTEQATVAWSAVSGATKYEVFTYLNDKWTSHGTTTACNMTVKNLTGGTSYGFVVKAYVNGSWSGISNMVYATPVKAAVPKPVITSANAGTEEVALTWSAVQGASQYAVYTYLNNKWELKGTTTACNMTVKNLTGGTSYGFAVKAYVNGEWSDPSDKVYATPKACEIPKPAITSAKAQDSSVLLSWSTVSGASQYAVYYITGGKWYNVGTTTATAMTVSGLTNGTKYGFAVKAYVSGKWSAITTADIVYATPEAAVTKPVITKAQGQDGRVALNWTSVNGATNYAVYTYLNGKWSVAGYRTANGMYVTGLINGVKYGFAVKAYVNGSWSGITSADIVYATPVGASVKPVITKAQGQDGRVALNWTSVNGATNYAVYTYLNGKWSLAGYRTANGMYVTGLTNGVKYGFAVKAYVNGAWTNIVSSDIVYATPTANKADVMYADTESFISDDIFDIGIDDIDIGLPDIA